MKRQSLNLFILCSTLFAYCSSDEVLQPENLNIYVAGYIYEVATDKQFAVYWKNGEAIFLTDGSNPAGAHAIVVDGPDIYVAGFESNGNYNVAKYWKNGIGIEMANGLSESYATSIAIAGDDVYASGVEFNTSNIKIAKYS